MFPTLLGEIQGVSLNPFAGFADAQYEPAAEYSIPRGVYLSNMPTTAIFPIMSDENINSMVIPSLQSSYGNPLLQQQPSLFTVAKQTVRAKIKNARPNQLSSSNIRDQGNVQQNPRAVTLDIRGGGYRLEQPRTQRPYKPQGSGETPTRNNAQRPNNARNTASGVNRKQMQRPRNPSLQNPHYNMKFETPLASIPSNVELVNPENVLPLHPRFYKQFLQQNPQSAAFLRAQKQPQSRYPGTLSSTSFDATKQILPNLTRNRGVRPNSQLPSPSFSNGPTNFQIPAAQQIGTQLNFAPHGQPTLNQGRQPTFEDYYNSDPQFYAALSQTPEGKAMLHQMYQQLGSSANKPGVNAPNKTPTSIVPKANPFAQTYADINSYSAAAGFPAGNNMQAGQISNQYGNNFGLSGSTNAHLNKPVVPNYSSVPQFNQRPQLSQSPQQQIPQTVPQQQTRLQHQPALQPQSVSQAQVPQSQHQSYPSSPQLSSYSGRQPYEEANPSPTPSPEHKKQYHPSQEVNNQYNSFAGTKYTDESPSPFASDGVGYDPSTYQSPYQENPKVVDGSTIDHVGYSSNFSPIDPISPVQNNNGRAPNYYTYQSSDSSPYNKATSHRQRFSSSALHEISPSEIVKKPAETSSSFRPQPPKVANSPGYWTPEQLFAPESTGLQNESPFAHSSSISSSSQPEAQDEQQDGKRFNLICVILGIMIL